MSEKASHAPSSGNSIINKRNAGIAAVGLAGLGTLAYAPGGVQQVVGTTKGVVGTVLEMGGETLNNGTAALTSVVGINAPFAAPMVAGGYLGKKVADFAEFGKWGKLVSTGVGAAAGASLYASAVAPYLTAVATGTVLYKGIRWATGKKATASH